MDIAKIKRTRRVQVTVGDESFWIEYIPRRWDLAFVEQHNALLTEESEDADPATRGRARYLYTLSTVLDDWDITQDGKRLPVSPDMLATVEDLYLLAMYMAIRVDIEEREKEKN
jgi:hypothetical protein